MKLSLIDRLIVAVLLLIPLVIACVGVLIGSIKGSIKMVTMDRMLKLGGLPAGVGLAVLAGTESRYFLIPLVLLMAFLGWSSFALRCPTCGWCVHRKPWRSGQSVPDTFSPGAYYIGSMEKRCVQCGADLTQVQFDWKMFHWNWRPSNPHPNFPYPNYRRKPREN